MENGTRRMEKVNEKKLSPCSVFPSTFTPFLMISPDSLMLL